MQTGEPDLNLNLEERPERHYFRGITATRWYRLAFLFPVLEFLWLAVFYTFCYRVRLNLGHWPESIIEDGGLGRSVHSISAQSLYSSCWCFFPYGPRC